MTTIGGTTFKVIRSNEPTFKIQIDIFKALKELSSFCETPFIFDASKMDGDRSCVIVASSQISNLEAQAILQNS